jgi:hypothetical protein
MTFSFEETTMSNFACGALLAAAAAVIASNVFAGGAGSQRWLYLKRRHPPGLERKSFRRLGLFTLLGLLRGEWPGEKVEGETAHFMRGRF